MKKILVFAVVFLISGFMAINSQTLQEKAKALIKPADIGVADYDAFKNSSFSLKDEVLKTDKSYDQLSKEVVKYAKGGKKLTYKNVSSDLNKVKNIKTTVKALNDRVGSLAETGKKLSTGAAGVKPGNKVQQATTNTNTSLQAVDLSREILKGLTKKVDADMGTLTGLLSKAIGKR